MSAFFNEPKLKQAVMDRLREDRRLDRLAQGVYFEDGKGCHLGCLTRCNENSHEAVERMFNIPVRIAYWLEAVFENLPEDQCEWWVIEGTNAIPVGADLSKAHHELGYWMLGPDSPSAKGNQNKAVAKSISKIRTLHRQSADGATITKEQWSAAYLAADSVSLLEADSAACLAARSAANSVCSAAESTADSAAESAHSAVDSAAGSVSMESAWSNAWKEIADKSIEIFQSCPLIECDKCEGLAQMTMASIDEPLIVKL